MPAAAKQNRNRKLMVYAGVAGAIVALVVILKKRSATSTEPGTSEAAGPTYASAPGSIPAAGETTQSELARYEQALSAQLPTAIEEGVKAGLQGNQTAAPPPQSNSLAEVVAALGGFATAIRGNNTGEQTQQSPSLNTPAAQPAVAPAAPPPAQPVYVYTPPPPAAPPAVVATHPQAPSPGYATIRCGNGCEGHRYSDGRVACQIKNSRGQCYWP
jgi:hypothetical protein